MRQGTEERIACHELIYLWQYSSVSGTGLARNGPYNASKTPDVDGFVPARAQDYFGWTKGRRRDVVREVVIGTISFDSS